MDIYETRKGNNQKIIPRQDNVLFGGEGFLTDDQLKFYKDSGYIVIKGFFDKRHLNDAKIHSVDVFNGKTRCETVTEPTSSIVRSAVGVHCFDPYKNIISNSNIGKAVKSILGDDVYIHQSRINFKEGLKSTGWSWHSDFETWHSQDGMPKPHCLSAIVPLTKNTTENGALVVIPKSHKWYVSCEKPKNHSSAESNFKDQKEGIPSPESIKKIMETEDSEPVTLTCDEGDLVLFDCNLLHVSAANLTRHQRKNLFFVFNRLDNMLVEPYIDSNPRPESMGARKNIFKI